MSRARTAEEATRLLASGEAPTQVARRLARSLDGVARALHRAGETDRARELWAEAKRQARSRR